MTSTGDPRLDTAVDEALSAGPAVARALRAVPADLLAERLHDRLEGGAWGCLDLLDGRPLLRTPALERALGRLRDEGRDDLADRTLLVDGVLRDPDAARRDAQAWAAARVRPGPGATPRAASRQESLDLARTGTPTQVRRALTRLAVAPGGEEDPELRRLVDELLHHPVAGVRLHAHRASRTALDRRTYLGHTEVLLGDPQPSVVRSAIRIVCHARWEPAAPAVTDLLGHPHPVVREAAAEGLVRLGASGVPPLRHAAARARPDHRARYTDVLERITTARA
ncbi:HEAT repeat domain-containing protein [uncultured Streptomyces sp.]|uniref:HEAT repeat domain-containing protein n=1 Tax=uncultured Streptomyces sp. TaxID=174707 RepID=UPI00260481C0|nr:HEAT repeat domain-containing protein [uncultured Streptomyces sp.]